MADNVAVTPGTGATVAADDVGGVLFQRVKVTHGADGSATDVSPASPLPAKIHDGTTAAKVAPASTPPTSADPGLIVAIRPDSLVAPAVAFTDRSGTITTGGTFQQAAASNTARTFLQIHNPEPTGGTDLWFSVTGTASAAAGSGGTRLAPGGTATYDVQVPSGAVSVLSATTGKAFTVKEA
jgi:hypothetical protein